MFSVNGYDLSTSQFEALKDLLEHESEIAEYSVGKSRGNRRLANTYNDLVEMGLVDGIAFDRCFKVNFIYDNGSDFVHDFEKWQKDEKSRKRDEALGRYKLSMFEAAIGFAAGIIGSLFLKFVVGI